MSDIGKKHKKKIIIFAGKNVIGFPILNRVVAYVTGHLNLDITLAMTVGPKLARAQIPPIIRYSFYESRILSDVIAPVLNTLPTIWQPNEDGFCPVTYTAEQLARVYGVKVLDNVNVNDPEFIGLLEADPEILGAISIRNFQIFKADIIETLQKKGFFWNLHPGLLPGYRGLYAPLRAYDNGESHYGWSLHNVDQGIDTGDLISEVRVPIDFSKSLFHCYYNGTVPAADMIQSAINQQFKTGKVPTIAQDESKKNYYSFPEIADFERWEKQGINLVASPFTMLNTYTEIFSSSKTSHAASLQSAIVNAIAEFERGNELGTVRTTARQVA